MSMRKKLLTVLFCCLMVMLFTDLVGQTKMPKLIGLDIKEAKQLINKNGLTLKGVREIQSRAPAGTVIRQRPIPQRAVPEGGGVILVVSLGPTGKMPQPPKDEIKQPVPDVEQDVEGEKDEEPLLKPRRVPKKPARTIVSESVNADTLIFKLTEGTGLRLRQGKLALVEDRLDEIRFKRFNLTRQLIRTQMDSLNRIFSGRQIRLVNRLFSASEQDLDRDRTDAERRSGNELADLNLYLMIVLRQGQNLARMCDRLNQLPVVEIAYPKPEFSLPQCRDVAPATPSYVASQDYLGPAPDGIDAYYAWLFPGGEGENIQVMDIEYGWTLTHEDLPGVFYINAPVMRYEDHGTAVLSILAGCSNSYGITGIVHQADIGIFSCWTISIADAINSATQILDPGDIILLEQQTADSINGINLVPVEYHQAEYDAIKAATAGGYVVVEAAGNGDENLDRRAFNDIFDRDFRDSGAIMIGAADAYTHVPSNFTTYGDRVDVHAWGQRIWCAGYGVVRVNGLDHNQWYTNDFSGTSGASAITAGAVASIQSFLLQQGRQILSSQEMRNLLRNTGTPQAADAKQIGPMTDLRRAFESLNQCCMAAGKFNDDAYIDLAIGIPYANIGTNICTGVVVVLKGTASGLDVSNPVVFHQDTENIPGGAESYDRFGAALAA
ncbi:S8 family serine peptidase, partial [candidate division KSB1 bacterium]|nr:S8 family serine peptidase [candidate division KSB1 bacterium]